MTSRIVLYDVTDLEESELLGGASPLHSGIASLKGTFAISEYNFQNKKHPTESLKLYLIETTFRKSCNKHGKPLSDDNVDSRRTPFIPIVGAELTVGQDVHDVVDGVRGQQLLKCSLDAFRFLKQYALIMPGFPSCRRRRSLQCPQVLHR